MFNFGVLDNKNNIPQANLLFYTKAPNGIGVNTGKYILPDATDDQLPKHAFAVAIRAATGWSVGAGNLFYEATGTSLAVSSLQITEWAGINQYHTLFSTAKGLVIYDSRTVPLTTLNKVAKWVRVDDYTPTTPNVTIFSGDSTLASYHGFVSVSSLVDLPTTNDIAVPGETTLQQKAHFDILTNKADIKYIVIQVGLNDLTAFPSATTIISRIQSYVDGCRAVVGPFAKIIISKMSPARQRFTNLFGETNGAICYATWQAVNEAIAGNGPTAITGVHARVISHADTMSDGSGNLLVAYDSGDGIHPNNAGREVNATAIEEAIYLLYNGIAPLMFGVINNAGLATLVTSEVIPIKTSLIRTSFISTGGEVQINEGEWVTSGILVDGDNIKARVMSSILPDSESSMTIVIGLMSSTFKVFTTTNTVFAGGLIESEFLTSASFLSSNMTVLETTPSHSITINGRITRIVAQWTNPPSPGKSIQFRVYRPNGANVDYVGSSETIETGTVGVTVHVLATGIDCQIGDLVGIYMENAVTQLRATSIVGSVTRYKIQDILSSAILSSFNTSTNYSPNLAFYGVPN